MIPDLHLSGRVLLGLALLGAAPAGAQQPWALTNARIETVSRGVIERGTILIRDGLITAVGAGVAVPSDARVMDLNGRTVTPGLIDLTSTMGLPAQTTGTGGGGGGGFGGGLGRAAMSPDLMVSGTVVIPPAEARAAREAGFTAVLVAPSRGLFRGRSALMPLRDSADGSTAIRSPVAQHVGYQGIGGGQYPTSLLGVIAAQRQMLYDARRHAQLTDRWTANPRGMPRPEHDPHLEALAAVTRGAEPLMIDARNENEIRRASRLGREHGVRLTVVGATEAWRAVDALTGHGVVVSLNFPRPADVTGWRYRGSLRGEPGDSAAAQEAARKLIEGNAAALHRAGIRFALASGGARPGEAIGNVRKAVAAGLPADVALQALTIRAAELAGAGDMLGSIEEGKIANLVVSTGPVLAAEARVTGVFVDGVWYEAARTADSGRDRARAAPGATADVGGTWRITTNSPQGISEAVLTVTQEGASFSGTMTSDMLGSSPVTDGQVRGPQARWSIRLSFGGQDFVLGYSGQVNGTRMSGNVTAGDFGTFTFTGEKQP